MLLDDAVVERSGDPCAEELHGALAHACPERATLAEIVRLVLAMPHLRRRYSRTEDVLVAVLELDRLGIVRLTPRIHGQALQKLYQTGCTSGDRSLSYVATYERSWPEHRDVYDFAEARDSNAARKAFQRDIYLEHLEPYLATLAPGSAVLDMGCGVGRLTAALLERRFRLTCADASAEALKCAARVALHSGATVDSLDVVLCDVRDLSCFAAASFAATIALELVCYQTDAAASLRELVRVTAPGGLVAVSVEGLYGACIADHKLDAGVLGSVLDSAAIDIEDLISVRYFTNDELRRLLASVGLERIEIVGTQYTADGVFDRLATDEALGHDRGVRELLAVERAAAADPVIGTLARAWLATARVPDHGRGEPR